MMNNLEITLSNVTSTLGDYTPELESKLTVAHQNYWFSPQYRAGLWDGRTHFLKIPSLKFPTGLLFIIEEYCEENDIAMLVRDNRKGKFDKNIELLEDANILYGITLRPYQIEAINYALIGERGMLELPTASGKTEVAIAITKLLGQKTLFMVNTQDLLHQAAERFRIRLQTSDNVVGKIGDNERDLDCPITIATVQSLDSMIKRDLVVTKNFLLSFKVLFQDECHHTSSTSFARPAMFMHNAYYRYGLSGTALRRDVLSNMKAMAVIGPPLYSLKTSELIKNGHISDLEIIAIENPEKVLAKDWHQAYEMGIVRSLDRNSLIVHKAEEAFLAGKRVMILVKHIEHGKILSEMLKVPVQFLQGADNSAVRETTKKDFDKDGKFVLIASPIFDEGVDLPSINTLIIAAGGKSEWKTIQKVGRGLRKKTQQEKLIVYDFLDHGDFIKKHSKIRMKIYGNEGFKVNIYKESVK